VERWWRRGKAESLLTISKPVSRSSGVRPLPLAPPLPTPSVTSAVKVFFLFPGPRVPRIFVNVRFLFF
jgi:hypothetical protein